jgi:hypothetical protein
MEIKSGGRWASASWHSADSTSQQRCRRSAAVESVLKK